MKILKKRRLLLVVITALLVVTVAIIWIIGAPKRKTKAFLARYEITDLSALGFQYDVSINDKGHILGRDFKNHICIWSKHNGLTILNLPQEIKGIPVTFNNSDQISGNYDAPNDECHAFIWDANNGFVDLGTFGGKISTVTSMNNYGQVIGSSTDPNERSQPFFWKPSADMIYLHRTNDNPRTIRIASDLNNSGRVVGTSGNHAFLWDENNGLVWLPTPQDLRSEAYRINNSGKVAGIRWNGHKQGHLIIWDDPNNFRIAAKFPKNTWPSVTGINDKGEMVGCVIRSNFLSIRWSAFFFSDETGYINLGEIGTLNNRFKLPWQSHSASMPYNWALDINNKSQIVKLAKIKKGQYRAVLMTPKKTSKE
jgi:uncharacterized membrane protein